MGGHTCGDQRLKLYRAFTFHTPQASEDDLLPLKSLKGRIHRQNTLLVSIPTLLIAHHIFRNGTKNLHLDHCLVPLHRPTDAMGRRLLSHEVSFTSDRTVELRAEATPGFAFYRPRSMVGGDLHWIWKPYEMYEKVDYVRRPMLPLGHMLILFRYTESKPLKMEKVLLALQVMVFSFCINYP